MILFCPTTVIGEIVQRGILPTSKLDFYYQTNQTYSMKTIITSLFFLFSFCFTSCVEEEGSADLGQNKPRDSKFLIPTEVQSSCEQLEQHKSSDKTLTASK
jgi:hypothetical protein